MAVQDRPIFIVSVDTETEAFRPDPVPELRRLLTDVFRQLDAYPEKLEGRLRDREGQSVGLWGFEPSSGEGSESDSKLDT